MLRVINIIPQFQSGETNQDSEPNLAVNPAQPTDMAATAFTPAPAGSFAPLYVSTDGGFTWSTRNVVPGNGFVGTSDITVGFATAGGVLYAGILDGTTTDLRILRTADFAGTTPMTTLVTRSNVDQPWVVAGTVVAGPAAGIRLEQRTTIFKDGPPVRIALHPDGTVYAAYQRWASGTFPNLNVDVVVSRDDSWASGSNPFTALVDPAAPAGDGIVGRRVASGVFMRFNAVMGQERLGADLAIAVEPATSSTVWLAWCDRVGGIGGTDWTIHVRRSTDRGQNWSADLRTITNAKNPSLAVTARGRIGLLYQQFTGTRWVSQLELTNDGWTTPAQNLMLHTALANAPARQFFPFIGDYVRLLALGNDFYGVFCGNNTPDVANFPNGVTYQRNATWATQTLLNLDNLTPVAASIDPFLFRCIEDALQVVASTDVGGLWHTIRHDDQSWQPFFGDVKSVESNDPGHFSAVGCAGVRDDLHLVGLTDTGGMWHTIRHDDQSWQPFFGDVKSVESNDPGYFRAVACAGVNDDLHVVALTDTGGMWHTIRHRDGSWQPSFGDVKSVESNDPGHFSAVGCAGVSGELHVVGLTDDGRMWHTIRHDDQSWQPFFGDVKGVESNDPGYFSAVAAGSGVNGDLHLVAVTDIGGMWHTIRHRDGSWQPFFGDVKSIESNDPGHFSAVGCAGVNGEVHVVGLTDDGRMWHTIRHDDQSWQPFFGDVKGVESNDPGYFATVACAGVERAAGRVVSEQVTVPDVRELKSGPAVNMIRAAGLVPAITGTNTADAWVATQNPDGGTIVARGSTVSIFLRTGPQP